MSASEFNYHAVGESPLEGPPDQPLLGHCHGCYSFAVELRTWHPQGSQLLLNSVHRQIKSLSRHLCCAGEEGWENYVNLWIYIVSYSCNDNNFILFYSPSHLRPHDSQQVLPVELQVQGRVSGGDNGGQHGFSIWGLMLKVSLSTSNIM